MPAKTGAGSFGRCNLAVDTGDPALPVAGTGKLSRVRKSKRAPWRAAVLIGIHALIAAHITHFLLAGKTLSPVEPSESMYTLELGYVNAGFIFFAVALLGTLVFGRFFCGWACHIVALQDLCGWIMKKLGIRPKPFRSRLLVWVPVAVALYMFVWPSVLRIFVERRSLPALTNHIQTTGFWDTFPGPLFAVLTVLTCGFASVYFLGAKGFCTYGCPYGAFFYGLDRLSPGRILVTDACEQCGHCTATCTSNVRVHEEVRLYGMVVDPGCMKCMDCISVCPKGALHFGFGRPSLLGRRPAAPPTPRRYDFSVKQELFVAGICIAATLTFRGLYDGPPLLMSVALGVLTAWAALKLWQLFRQPSVRVQNLSLKLGGKIQRGGWVFASLTVLWLVFGTHSAFAQWNRAWGDFYLNRTEVSRADALSGAFLERSHSARHREAAQRALEHFERADRWGLVDVVEVKLGLAWSRLLENDSAAAEKEIQATIELSPDRPGLHQNLVDFLIARGRHADAALALQDKIRRSPPTAQDHFLLAGLLIEAGRHQEAVDAYRACLLLSPGSAEAHYNLGGLLRRLGRPVEAVAELEQASGLAPADADTHIELGLALRETGASDRALEALRRAVDLAPDSAEARFHLPGIIAQLELEQAGRVHGESSRGHR